MQYLSLAHSDLAFAKSSLSAYAQANQVTLAGCQTHLKASQAYFMVCFVLAQQDLIVSFFSSNLISWSSQKQPIITRVRHSMNPLQILATTKLEWIQSLLRDLSVVLPSPPKLWCDNIGLVYLLANLVFMQRRSM